MTQLFTHLPGFNWLTKNWHLPAVKLAIILTIGGLFLRLFNLPGNVMFLGDQGRDALIVADIFQKKDLVFIGPVTSVGNMYLGPLYYYFMLPFLWLSYPSPLGPVYAVAILNGLAVLAIFALGKHFFNTRVGLLAAAGLALNSVAIYYSRFSWNPNLAIVASLGLLYCQFKAPSKPRYWLGVSLAISVLIQLHYLTLLAMGTAGLLWVIELIKLWPEKTTKKFRSFWQNSLLAGLIFLLSLTPLLLFDLRHQGLNTQAFWSLITGSGSFNPPTTNLIPKVWRIIKETDGRAMQILFDLNWGQHRTSNRLLVIVSLLTLGWIFKHLPSSKRPALKILLSYLIIGIAGTAVYQHTVFDHYILYLLPVTLLCLAVVIDFYWQWLLTRIICLGLIGFFLIYNLNHWPLKSNGLFHRTAQTAAAIVDHLTPADQYNLVLFSESKDLYGQSYRYFLSTSARPPLPLAQASQAQTLVLISETRTGDELSQPIYELLTFPCLTISDEFSVNDQIDVKILRCQP